MASRSTGRLQLADRQLGRRPRRRLAVDRSKGFSISITMGTPASNLNKDQDLRSIKPLSWLATLRGRIGYDREGWLWYATGGAALGSVTNNDLLTFGFPTTAANFNHTQGGWTVGAGIEKVITGHWTAKLEYLYVDLGSITDSSCRHLESSRPCTRTLRITSFALDLTTVSDAADIRRVHLID